MFHLGRQRRAFTSSGGVVGGWIYDDDEQTGGGSGDGLATAVLPDGTPDMLLRCVDRLPRDLQVRIGRDLFCIAMSERAQDRLIDEAARLYAALDDLEDQAREDCSKPKAC